MEHVLSSFSANLADLAESAGQSAVGIEARHRIGSSGFLWKPGIIITAAHAIRRDDEIPVVLPDGKRSTAELVGRDLDTDVAVLKIDAASAPSLAAAPGLRTGEIVLAIGPEGGWTDSELAAFRDAGWKFASLGTTILRAETAAIAAAAISVSKLGGG